jgi:DNA-binding NarL/FixJ family response regulator
MFGVAIYSDLPTILTSGIEATLMSDEEIKPCTLCTTGETLHSSIKTGQYQVLFFVLKDILSSHTQYNLIKEIKTQYFGLRIIALAPRACKDMVFETIKSGASGFLSADATVQELKEAVYTIRAGHEYFSSSITKLLVNNYVETMRSETHDQVKYMDKLGKREMEVLTLWGEGRANTEIADILFISVRTVESHKNHIMQKLGIRTTVDLLKFAIRNNIVSI